MYPLYRGLRSDGVRRALTTIAAAVALGASGCGGGDGGGGMQVDVDPDLGPAGTEINWTVSGCEEDDTKSVTLYSGSRDEYEEGDTSKVAEGPRGKSTSGTLAVPADASPGEYTVAAACTSSTEPTAEGQITISVASAETSFVVSG